MSADLAAKLLTLLTLAEVWLKMRSDDDLARAHKDMHYLLDFPPDGVEMELADLLRQAEVWRRKPVSSSSRCHEAIARCHADMRALLEGCVN
jgi:hypothetical protein